MAQEKKKKKKRAGDIILTIVLVIAICVFIVSAYMLIKYFLEYKEGTDTYDDISEAVTNEDQTLTADIPYINWNDLKALSDDAIGWIYIPDMVINYPIVKGEDNDYYLKHMADGTANSSGAIFMEALNSADYSDENTIIYGHNMKNLSMFGSLRKFRDQEFAMEHPVFYIYTEDGIYEYDIFSVRVVEAGGDCYTISFATEEDYADYLNKAVNDSLVDMAVYPTSKDRIVTLSTCTGNDATRLVVQGVRGDKVEVLYRE